jgi:hypothetical protein
MRIEGIMNDFFAAHASEIWSAIVGCVAGGTFGSLITIKVARSQQAKGNGRNVDQSRAKAGGDIVGGNKSTTFGSKPPR